MRSWRLVPKITYSIYHFSQHSCVLGLQFKQSVKAPGPLCLHLLTWPDMIAHTGIVIESSPCRQIVRRTPNTHLSPLYMPHQLTFSQKNSSVKSTSFQHIQEKPATLIYMQTTSFGLIVSPPHPGQTVSPGRFGMQNMLLRHSRVWVLTTQILKQKPETDKRSSQSQTPPWKWQTQHLSEIIINLNADV